MAKSREIPGQESPAPKFSNSAPVDQVKKVQERVESLGWGWHDAVEKAGLSRNVGYTLLRGTASIGSLRIVEKWTSEQEQEQAKSSEDESPKEAWARLGDELLALGEDHLTAIEEALREYISAEKRRRAALSKMLGISRR